jgi:hypothetical protein
MKEIVVKNKGLGVNKVEIAKGDPDWSLNQDWDSEDFDLSPKNPPNKK